MLARVFVPLVSLVGLVVSAPAKVEGRQAPSGVPDYVIKYAPVVYLHSAEVYFPSDLQVFLDNTIPRANYQEVSGPRPLNANNVNAYGQDVYLTSEDDVTTNPAWIKGVKPDKNGKTNGAVSSAIIVNDKGGGNVDAFYFYWYIYNWGGKVLGLSSLNFGNHVGDWEHNMIRFSNGVPQYIWYSQHANGQAFKYSVTEKYQDVRPIAYSSNGSHANYAMGGTHDHLIPNLNLPGGALEDYTNKGYFWDPTQSAYYFKFDAGANKFTPYDESGATPVNWLNFKGRWGDQEYPTSDKRQVKLFGQAKYGSGPTGPADKQLNRAKVCPENGNLCILRSILVPRSHVTDGEVFQSDEVQA
ncbi:hypothetical protein BS50DRAFT_571435 [Corynespora cassiicola Philippines]|uniref:Vacuolar protein sorting-associated protein 62 n=1 Tax=Corynespora cassiicola Philippines TaxID=1448308 RepID=A0A2T2NXJ9_CORCC|nr:hypothetical protein BS50DRAFT_571435 [Corynespora cassiicola Philippines]